MSRARGGTRVSGNNLMRRRAFVTRALGLTSSTALLMLAGANRSSIASSVRGHRVLDLDLFDHKRQRRVPSRLYLPAQVSSSRPVPLVVFSHGLGGSRAGYSYLASHWSNEGVASLHPQHVGSDNAVWRGNPLELVQRLQFAAQASEARARTQDLRFALDHVLASEYASFLDGSRIAAAGHSYGANTAMLVSGARVMTSDADWEDLRDERVRAAILISAPPLVGQGPMERVLGPVSIPTLHITSVNDTIALPGYRSTFEDRIAIFNAMNGSPRTLAVFNIGGHSIFTDRTTTSGPETSARIKGATRELCTLFLSESLSQADVAGDTGAPHGVALQEPKSLALRDNLQANPALGQWLLRHETLLDRFIQPIHVPSTRS